MGYNDFNFVNKWSWRGLNPRPVVDSMSFLHAYSHVGFRVVTGKRRPIATLSSKVSRRLSRLSSPYFRFTFTTWSIRLGKRTIGWCLVSATVAEIKLIYYSSIKQRERSCFRHLNFWCRWLKSVGIITLHAYSSPLTLSKPISPF